MHGRSKMNGLLSQSRRSRTIVNSFPSLLGRLLSPLKIIQFPLDRKIFDLWTIPLLVFRAVRFRTSSLTTVDQDRPLWTWPNSTAIFGHELFFGSEDGPRVSLIVGPKVWNYFIITFLTPLSSSHLAMMMSIWGNNVSGVGDQNTPQDITKVI